jgi:DNA/RNA endonuclease G (NUC1)
MKKLILVLLFLPLFSFAQKRDSVYVQNKVFTLVYSEILEQPKWIKYRVTCAGNNVSRKGLDFYKEKTIHTSDNEDYVANDWDKGHMAPAAAFGCDIELLKQTFTYLNSALQHKSLNRGVWKELEEYERQLRQKADDIEIYIRVDFNPPLKKVQGGATIPSGFYKTIKSQKLKISECYYFNNTIPHCAELKKFRVNCE